MNRRFAVLFCLLLTGLFLFSTPLAGKRASIEAEQATEEIPEELLLDVGIQVLDSGWPEDEEDVAKAEEKGVFKELRKSEARYFAYHLKSTMEATGYWGAVRVVPGNAAPTDVMITGEIHHSTGLILELKVKVVDSTGRLWKNRQYEFEADSRAYIPEEEMDGLDVGDPYQSLYNNISNDILIFRERLRDKTILEIRDTTNLKFAADLVPSVYEDYLKKTRNDRFKIKRMPSEGDPMMARIASIHQRDDMFVDTLNEHYAGFYNEMGDPYNDWRSASYEEEEALRRIRRKARTMKILGALMTIGGLASSSSSSAGRAAGDAAVIGGVLVVQQGIQTGKGALMHKEALKELGASVDAEVAPILVEVEGRTLRLEGSAEAQYTEWRRLLAEIFAEESGLPVAADEEDGVEDGSSRPADNKTSSHH